MGRRRSTAIRLKPRLTVSVAAIAALMSLLLFASVPGEGLWHDVLLDVTHGPIFAAIAVLVLLMHPTEARVGIVPLATAFLVSLVLGGLIEVLQSLGNRPGSLFDVMTDAAGAATGLAVWRLVQDQRQHGGRQAGSTGRRWSVAIALAGVTTIAWQPLQAARAYAHQAAEFPTIAAFRGPRDLAFVESQGTSAEIVELPVPWSQRAGEHALRIRYVDQQPRAVQVVEPSRDWRGYSAVAVDLTNPTGAELRLTLRIFDASHRMDYRDRFNLPIAVPPRTRATVRVTLDAVESSPMSRRMDLSRIADVMIFGQPSDGTGEFFVSRLWLE